MSKESLFRQQASGFLVQTLLFYACCFPEKTGHNESKLARFTERPGYLCLCLSRAAKLPRWGPAVSFVSLSQTCCLHRRHTCATSAFCASEAVNRKVCWLSCCAQKDRRLNTELRFTLVSELAHVAGPTDTYGPYCIHRYQYPGTNRSETSVEASTDANLLPASAVASGSNKRGLGRLNS